MDGTTAIKIDYYEELKAKADKWDEKEVGTKPEVYNEKTKTYLCGNCQQFIDEIDDYCMTCGFKHDWTDL